MLQKQAVLLNYHAFWLNFQNILIRVNHPAQWSSTNEDNACGGVLLMRDLSHHPRRCGGGSSSSAPSSPLLSPVDNSNVFPVEEDHSSSALKLHLFPRLTIEQLTTRPYCSTRSHRHSNVDPPLAHQNMCTLETCQLPKVTPLVAMNRGSADGPEYTAVVGDLGVCLDLNEWVIGIFLFKMVLRSKY